MTTYLFAFFAPLWGVYPSLSAKNTKRYVPT